MGAMNLSRRRFLQILGGTAAAAVVAPSLVLPEARAPLFVPPQHLDFGVPSGRLVAARATAADLHALWQESAARMRGQADIGQHVPMLLLQDNYIQEYGGKLKMGSEVLVDQTTAERWIRNGVAEPGPSAPRDLQLRSAQRRLERRSARLRGDHLDIESEHGRAAYAASRYTVARPGEILAPPLDSKRANDLIREMLRA